MSNILEKIVIQAMAYILVTLFFIFLAVMLIVGTLAFIHLATGWPS
jgi:ABC-type dipeptide/oligopeptide/nickel transport system permease subunit